MIRIRAGICIGVQIASLIYNLPGSTLTGLADQNVQAARQPRQSVVNAYAAQRSQIDKIHHEAVHGAHTAQFKRCEPQIFSVFIHDTVCVVVLCFIHQKGIESFVLVGRPYSPQTVDHFIRSRGCTVAGKVIVKVEIS